MSASRLVHVAAALGLASCAAPAESSSPTAEPRPSASASTEPAGDWGCLHAAGAAPSTPAKPLAEHRPADTPFHLSLVEAFTRTRLGRLELAVCARADADCAAPLSQARADDAGEATLMTPGDPSSFDGFVRVSGAGLATHYVFLLRRTPAQPVELYTPAALATAARTAALALDPRKAVVRVDAHDCADAPVAGVAVSVGSFAPGEPTVAYATEATGQLTRKATRTDGSGIAVAFAVPDGDLGVAEVIGHAAAGGALAFARAGAVSEVVVRP